jgi:hypothetical protein
VILHGCVLPVTRDPGARPLGSPLARAQVGARLEQLTTLLPGNAPLAAETARLLTLLDGTRDRAALSRELGTGDAGVNTSLGLLGEAGFLMTAP